jgi:glycosyltransferase involved in cell wall biosynthesis
MNIAISGYEANIVNRVGIGRYAFEIISGINRLVSDRKLYPDVNITVYLPNEPLAHLPRSTDYWQYRVAPPKWLWNFIGFPAALSFANPKPDVIFSPTHYIPRFTRIPQAFSIMDLSYEYYPELFKKSDLYKLKNWTRYSARQSKLVFTISRFSKDAIIKTYGVPDKSVIVTYPGLTQTPSANMTKNEISRKYGISQNYIISVGTLQPRKNFVRLIEAFSGFLVQNKQKFKNPELVIVGKKGWLYDEIIRAPDKYRISASVKFLDYVPDSDLPHLYKYALCFALPSLYEGFGLPVLEAMAQGCPVVVSNTSSLPEIAGNAGVYVDPENPESITRGILTAVRERNLMQGRKRISYGLGRVREFTWDKAAKQTLDVLIQAAVNK